MTPQLYDSVYGKIKDLLSEHSASFPDDTKQKEAIEKLALLYDRLLYEQAGKKVPYQDYRNAYFVWNKDPLNDRKLYTHQELADYLNTTVSTVHQIVTGKYWPFHGYSANCDFETEKQREIRQRYGQEYMGWYPQNHYIPIAEPPKKKEYFTVINEVNIMKDNFLRIKMLTTYEFDLVVVQIYDLLWGDITIEHSEDCLTFTTIGKPYHPRVSGELFNNYQQEHSWENEIKDKDKYGELITNIPKRGNNWYRACYTFDNGDIAYTEPVQNNSNHDDRRTAKERIEKNALQQQYIDHGYHAVDWFKEPINRKYPHFKISQGCNCTECTAARAEEKAKEDEYYKHHPRPNRIAMIRQQLDSSKKKP